MRNLQLTIYLLQWQASNNTDLFAIQDDYFREATVEYLNACAQDAVCSSKLGATPVASVDKLFEEWLRPDVCQRLQLIKFSRQ